MMSSEVREPTVDLHGVGGNRARPWQEQHNFDRWREMPRDSRRGTARSKQGGGMSVSPEAGRDGPAGLWGPAKLDRGLESA